jgi:hypothetical protein
MGIGEPVRDRLHVAFAELATHCTGDHIRQMVHAIVARLSAPSIRPAGGVSRIPHHHEGTDAGVSQPRTCKTILVADSKKHRELL